MFQIEKNVPLTSHRGGPAAKYPWRDMQVGDSFVMPAGTSYASNTASKAARYIGGGLKFSCRKVDVNSTRVWRIA